jgi:hypothetical protein
MSGYKSTGNLDKEKRPKITTAKKQSEVIIGFFTAPSYKLITGFYYFSIITSVPLTKRACPATTT